MAELIACLPGDGIGPEVLEQGIRVLESLPVDVEIKRLPFGGAAIDELGDPLPAATLEACRASRAVLLGAVGGPRWDGAAVRPEQGLIGVRKALDVYANLRPARQGDIDLVIVRELVGGLYYGARGVREDGTVFDTCEYHPSQIERVARRAFELAGSRSGSLISVDKANVLDTSRLWRRVVNDVAQDFPKIELRHALVDSFAMEVVTSPERIDVVVTENTFGDILSDIAAAVTGGLGLAASASLGDSGPGIFEPVHGSAPDIAGTGAANPAAMLRSVALLLEHALGRADLAGVLVAAVDETLVSRPTRDAGGDATTGDFGDAVLASLERRLSTKEEAEAWTPALS
jgi:3-isopropylmalate dehydrogenase